MKAHPNHHTFIIQEMIRGDTVRLGRHHLPYERTRRAFVIAYGHVDQPSRMAIKVALPYFSISKSKGGESPDEKDFYRLDMSRDEEKAISSFARTLLGSLYDKRQRRFPKHWESMAKPLTGGGPHRVEKHERSLRLALIGQALMQEHYSSFEKIGSSNIGRLKRVIANLTPREKRIIDFDMQRFFTYALIGHPQWPMPAGFVNHGLLEAFATHLSDLTRAQIRFYKDHIEDRIRDCEPPSHPLHHNLAFLRKLRALVDVPPRRIIRKA